MNCSFAIWTLHCLIANGVGFESCPRGWSRMKIPLNAIARRMKWKPPNARVCCVAVWNVLYRWRRCLCIV
jgi:hypothetical protein